MDHNNHVDIPECGDQGERDQVFQRDRGRPRLRQPSDDTHLQDQRLVAGDRVLSRHQEQHGHLHTGQMK